MTTTNKLKISDSALVSCVASYKFYESTALIAKELRKVYQVSDKRVRWARGVVASKDSVASMVKRSGRQAEIPEDKKPVAAGVVLSPDHFRKEADKGVRAFILTSAQNNTKVHAGFWRSLQKLAKDRKAQIMVSRFSYDKGGWQKITKDHIDGDGELWYAPEILPYVQDAQIKIAGGLLFCAELDILPTAKDPLSGLENYTGTNSMVVPHAKVHMRSYAGLASGQEQRFGYTTGTCTLRNYIDRRAGQIASYHHVYGALYVEVSADGVWFARQINAGDDGSFFELDTFYHALHPSMHLSDPRLQELFKGAPGRVANLGDFHAEKTDPEVFAGAMDMVRTLGFSHIAVHDLLDFEARNHHNLKDPFFMAEQHFNGMNTVEGNFRHAVTVLDEVQRNAPDATMMLIRSNHDEAFHRWLREFDGKNDPANARFYHYHMWKKYSAIEAGEEYDAYIQAMEEAAHRAGINTSGWDHVLEDESRVLYDIEFGLHGHLGPNGSRGSPKGYRQLGRKLNTGHTHSASILDGVWTAGVMASLRMGYNKGPSSWSNSHVITHLNGKRQMITQRGSRWRA